MEHVTVCGSRTDVCKKCLMRLMLKDMETHKCGVLQLRLQHNPYRAPPKPRPVVMGEAVSIGIAGPGVGVAIPPPYVVRIEREEVEGGEKSQVNGKKLSSYYCTLSLSPDQLLRDEEMAAALHAQYFDENLHHSLSSPCPPPLSPHRYSPQYSPHIYHYAINGEGGTNPRPSSSDEVPSQATLPELEGEDEEEERRRHQLLDDEEMARQLQEEEDQETNRLIAKLRQEEPVPHTLAQSPLPAYNAIEEEERRRRREREEEEVLIPCDVCGANIRFEDYQKHMVCDLINKELL